MNLRATNLMAIGLAMAVIVLVMLVYSLAVLERGYVALEEGQIAGDTREAMTLVSRHLDSIDATLRDYASWNDTFEYVRDRELEYEHENFRPELFQNAKIDAMLLFDRSGQLVSGREYNRSSGTLESVRPSLLGALNGIPAIRRAIDREQGQRGFVRLPGGPGLIAVEPILHDDYSGPSAGAMVMITALDQPMLESYPPIDGRPIRMIRPDQVPPGIEIRLEGAEIAESGAVRAVYVNDSTAFGLFPIEDLDGAAIGLGQVTVTRSIHQNGMAAVTSFILFSLLICGVFSGVALWFVDARVLRRISTIARQVERIRDGETARPIPDLGGQDELNRLAGSINAMVDDLSTANTRYRTLAEAAEDIIILIGPDRAIEYINPFASRWFGLDWRSDLSAHSLVPGSEEVWDRLLARAFGSASPVRNEVELSIRSESRVLDCTMIPLSEERNGIAGLMLIARDVTERRQHEEDRIRLARFETLGAMAGSVAHQFNNLITIIHGNLTLIQQFRTEPEKVGRFVHAANRATDRATIETNRLLTFAHGGEPILGSTRIEPVIEEAIELAGGRTGPVVTSRVEADLPGTLLDRRQLVAALAEILRNAREAAGSGGRVDLAAGMATDASKAGLPPGEYIAIVVGDTGPGVRRGLLSRVFDLNVTTKEGATGVGLTIARSVIRKHGGDVRISATGPEGTSVAVYLPVTTPAEEPE